MTGAVVPECTHVRDDTECDRAATHELTLARPGTFTGDRTEFACDAHEHDLIGEDMLVIKRNLHGKGLIFQMYGEPIAAPPVSADRLTVGSVTADRLTVGPVQSFNGEPLGIVTVPVPAKYRPSKWSSPWILLLGLIGYELWAVGTSKPGGPLSHLVWWTYGERWSLRWWLCSSALNGLGLWAAAHFMFEWPEVKELLITVACAVGVGLIGWFVTR